MLNLGATYALVFCGAPIFIRGGKNNGKINAFV